MNYILFLLILNMFCLIGDFNSRTGEDDDYVNVNFEHGDNNIDEFIENHSWYFRKPKDTTKT